MKCGEIIVSVMRALSIFFIIFFHFNLGVLCEVTFELYNASQSNINIVPGQKLCPM